MPAVTPAEVARLPSLTKIGSGSTVTSGYWAASSAQCAQWVVTLRPFSSPASASRNVPVQTDASLTTAPASAASTAPPCARSQATSSGSRVARPRSAGNQEQVGRAGHACRGRRREPAQPARRPHRLSAEAGGRNRVAGHRAVRFAPAVSAVEHLKRPGHVEALHPVEQDNQHRSACHQSPGRASMAAMTNNPPFPPSERRTQPIGPRPYGPLTPAPGRTAAARPSFPR